VTKAPTQPSVPEHNHPGMPGFIERRRPSEQLMMAIARSEMWAKIAMQGFRAAWIVAIAGFGYLSVKELAGKATIAQFFVDALVSVPERAVSPWWIAGAVAMFLWAAAERRLRLRKVSSMSDQLKRLEQQVDPRRTSSGLTATGETPAEHGD